MKSSAQSALQLTVPTKKPALAALLAFLFGPFGLFYVGWAPALILFILCVPVVMFTAGFGLAVTAPLCAVVGYTHASTFNKRLLASKS